MKNILLICAAGMSTSLVVKKMEIAAKDKGIDVSIKAKAISEALAFVNENDVILLGPQVRFQKKQVAEMLEKPIPIDIINIQAYGQMNGEKVLEQALSLIEGAAKND